jgi:4-amino-4-deoxychorismate lyase
MATNNDFQLFTSLRYDTLLLKSDENSKSDLNFVTPSPFYMLAYHRDRMVEAAQHFDFHEVEKRLLDGSALHKELQSKVDDWLEKNGQDVPLKVSRGDFVWR